MKRAARIIVGNSGNGTLGNGTLGNGTLGNGTLGNGTLGNGTLGNGTPGNSKPVTATLLKTTLAVATLAACGTTTNPSPDPPPTWGVPISGGNMIITRSGDHAVIADPDRDRVLDLDIATGTATELALQPNDEPGRLVEDGAGRVHIALRRGGALLTIEAGAIKDRRPACAEPRGVAYDATADLVHVACATGELVTFPAAGGAATRTVRVDRDLRDVLVANGKLYVTRFRSAELIELDASGAIASRVKSPAVKRPPQFDGGPGAGVGSGSDGTIDAIAAVAWRSVALPDGRILMSHQRQLQSVLSVVHGGYGGFGCDTPVEDAATIIAPGQAPVPVQPFASGALPVDLAVNSNGSEVAVVLAGAQGVQRQQVVAMGEDGGHCESGNGQESDDLGAPTSLAYRPNNNLLILYPEVPAVVEVDAADHSKRRIIQLPGQLGYDSGRGLFHRQTQSGLACASCHPEGREDGLIWKFNNATFTGIDVRRTQNLAGSIQSRAPYHWTGDQADLPTLMDDVFAVRMAGTQPTRSEHMSLGPFLDRVPAPAPIAAADPAAVDRGRALFESVDVGCVACHTGPLMSTKAVVDVGTGGKFKVPSLVGVGARAPFMHDGCAATLRDRFTTCGGGDMHGKTSTLTAAQLDDLIAYLETL